MLGTTVMIQNSISIEKKTMEGKIGLQIDLIKESDGILYPVEIIKMSAIPTTAMVKHFKR